MDALGRRRRAICIGFLIVLATAAHTPLALAEPAGDENGFQALRKLMRDWKRDYEVPSASAALMMPGRPIRKLRYGMLATEPARIASLSKAITAVCVARLIDAGSLAFDTRLGKVLGPTFEKLGRPTDPRFAVATIEQLLTHTAGFAREARRAPTSGDMTAMFKSVLLTPLRDDPGSDYHYSNAGYLTLGMVIEAVSRRPYEEQCRNMVLRPLGAAGLIDRELRHRAANGGWAISAVDYANFMQVWNPDASLLGPPSRRWLASRVAKSNSGNPVYALGTWVERTASGIRFSHGGNVSSSVEERGGSYAFKAGDGLTVVVLFKGTIRRGGHRALRQGINRTFASH